MRIKFEGNYSKVTPVNLFRAQVSRGFVDVAMINEPWNMLSKCKTN